MKLSINGRKMVVDEKLRERTEKKLAKFGRFFDEEATATVLMSEEKSRKKVEVTILNRGTFFRAQEVSDDFHLSLDGAVESLERQMRKNKTRLEKRLHSGAYEAFAFSDASEVVEEEEFEIVRVKQFSTKPMAVEEAILQMNLLDHSFFVFKNEEGGDITVVYRRKDGRYGLLAPNAI